MKKLNYTISSENAHEFLTYEYDLNADERNHPVVIFVGGYITDMYSTKANFLKEYCNKRKIDFIRFNYYGHGESSGVLKNGDIKIWLENLLLVIDEIAKNRSILLVGSSLGGWLSLLACIKRSSRIKAFIGIAAAPDFTKDLLEKDFTEEEKIELAKEGIVYKPITEDFSMPFSNKLILSGQKYLILNNKININIPVILLHGLKDNMVSYEKQLKIANLVTSQKVYINFIKNGDHSLSDEESLQILTTYIQKLYQEI